MQEVDGGLVEGEKFLEMLIVPPDAQVAVQRDLPRRRLQLPVQHAQQRRLPRPVAAHDRHPCGRVDTESQVLEQLPLPALEPKPRIEDGDGGHVVVWIPERELYLVLPRFLQKHRGVQLPQRPLHRLLPVHRLQETL